MSNFPIDEIEITDSVVCICCTAFGGENDVRHIFDKGVKNVWLVDIDRVGLYSMQDKYGYKCVEKDWYEFVQSCIAKEKTFDVVVVDGWTNMDEAIWSAVDDIAKICRRLMIIGISQAYATQAGISTRTMVKRSDHNGGVYWAIQYVSNNGQ